MIDLIYPTDDIIRTIEELNTNVPVRYPQEEAEESYDDMLDDCYDLSCVGGPFANMSASHVLESVDPTAYRCGVIDYADSLRSDILYDHTELGDDEYYPDDLIEEAQDYMSDNTDDE